MFNFFPSVGQIGEKAVHLFPHHGTGSQALVSGCFLAYPTLDGLVGVEIWTVTGEVHQAEVQAGSGQVGTHRVAPMGWRIVPDHDQWFSVPLSQLTQESSRGKGLLLPSSSITATSSVSRHTAE